MSCAQEPADLAVEASCSTQPIPKPDDAVHRRPSTSEVAANDNSGLVKRKTASMSEYMRRPGWGSRDGRNIDVVTNYFAVSFGCPKVFMYDITVVPGVKMGTKFRPHFTKPDDRRMSKATAEYNREIVGKFQKRNCSPGQLFYDPETKTPIIPCYDGVKTLYTSKLIVELGVNKTLVKREIVSVDIDGRSVSYEVQIKYSSQTDMTSLMDHCSGMYTGSRMIKHTIKRLIFYCLSGKRSSMPLDALKAADIILLNGPADKRLQFGMGTFPTSREGRLPVGTSKEIAFGHFQTARSCSMGSLCINIDRLSAVFHVPGSLFEIMARISAPEKTTDDFLRRTDFLDSKFLDFMSRKLTGLKVSTTHLPYKRKFKITEITRKPADELFFDMERSVDGRVVRVSRMSVAQYFESEYKRKLRYPKLPCLKVGPAKRPVYFPLEVINVEPNQNAVNLRGDESKRMIKLCSSQTTDERFKIISSSAVSMKKDSLKFLPEFGIEIATEPVKTTGVVVSHPKLLYKDENGDKRRREVLEYQPSSGRWDMSGKTFYDPAVVNNWLIVNMSGIGDQDVETFVRDLMAEGAERGMRFDEPHEIVPSHLQYDDQNRYRRNRGSRFVYNADPDCDLKIVLDDLYSYLRKAFRKYIPNLILFVILNKVDNMYQQIKYFGDKRVGITTQCVSDTNIDMALEKNSKVSMLTHNLLLKINTKMGGSNCVIDKDEKKFLKKRTMIMGADVTHPGRAAAVNSSLAAITASYDPNHVFYAASVSAQLGYNEIIHTMEGQMSDLLEIYAKHNSNEYPESIIYYRDGVSDGMFRQVIDAEIKQIRRACQNIARTTNNRNSCKPDITCIIVQKRHHSRFMPANVDDRTGSGNNVPSGTTIDETIVHPTDFDFFMCSQESLHVSSAQYF